MGARALVQINVHAHQAGVAQHAKHVSPLKPLNVKGENFVVQSIKFQRVCFILD